jgi:hypothetical protein
MSAYDEIGKYKNIRGSLYKKIGVKLMLHICMLRELKLVTYSASLRESHKLPLN